jgi:hypothetical protein
MYYRVNSDINGLKFSHTSEILNFTLPWEEEKIPKKKRKLIEIDRQEYIVHLDDFTKAKVHTLKNTINSTFTLLLKRLWYKNLTDTTSE